MIIEHLFLAERHVSEGQAHLQTQRKVIAELERDGHDTVKAKDLLKKFISLESLHIAHRDRLRDELIKTDQ